MPGFFEALDKLKTVEKKHEVTIQGKTLSVSLEKKIEIIRAGEDKYMIKDGQIERKPKTKTKRTFPVLKSNRPGYVFYEGNPFWVARHGEEGYEWQIESE